MKKLSIRTVIWATLMWSLACESNKKDEKVEVLDRPNIIVIYADDLGVGDVSCYGATSISTPNIDRIAHEGIRFTNGYATSATCTPSRYALLTGQYPWKNERAEILAGNAPLLLDTAKQTLPAMLQSGGYQTAVIGKWHLGLGNGDLDWNGRIYPGPRDLGFDHSYIMASTNDRVPSVYVQNDKVDGLDPNDPIEVSYASTKWPTPWKEEDNYTGEPTGRENPELLKMLPSHGHDMSIHNGISRIGFMRGGKSALWTDEDMADTILSKSIQFIESNKDQPFFLFYALNQPHVPRTPHPRFVGKSGMGPRGDVILEADWCVGQLLTTLDSLGLSDNTIVIFSSDNGPVLDDGYEDLAEEKIGDHKPTGSLRGGKYSLYDAGTRVPFMLRWPQQVKPGVSDALVCQMDLMASFAALLGLESNGPDSENILSAFVGESKNGRTDLVLEAMGKLAYRKENWVLIPPYQGSKIVNKWVKNETGYADRIQLYNLAIDPGQKENLADQYPDQVKVMSEDLSKLAEAIK